jgi:molybdopterin converting factor small subunit
MPRVKLKLTRLLCQNEAAQPANVGAIAISVPDGQTILGMVQCLAAEKGGVWDTILQEMGDSILAVRNGSLVDQRDQSEAPLEEGDELMFLPMVAGG